MIVLRLFCAVGAFALGVISLLACGLALWLDLQDQGYALSILLTIIGFFCGIMAVQAWKFTEPQRTQAKPLITSAVKKRSALAGVTPRAPDGCGAAAINN